MEMKKVALECVVVYIDGMSRDVMIRSTTNRPLNIDEQLQSRHDLHCRKALDNFDHRRKSGKLAFIQHWRERLEKAINQIGHKKFKECMKAQAVYDEITRYYKKHVTSANYLDLQHVEAVNYGRRRMKVELSDQEIIKLVDQSFTKYTDERQSSGYQTWPRRAAGQSTRFQVAILGSTVVSSVVGVCIKTSMFRFGGVIVGGMVVYLLFKLWSSGAASPVTINFLETTSKQLKREIELYFENPDFVGMFVKDF